MNSSKKFIILLLISIFCTAIGAKPKDSLSKINPLSETLKEEVKKSGIWQPNCPISLDDLRVVSVSYYDFSGHPYHNGKILVAKTIAASTVKLFRDLYLQRFQFSAIDTLLSYHGSWQEAENNNVTYGYICNTDLNKKFIPESYGKVITLNPALNPEIMLLTLHDEKFIGIQPNTGLLAINRKLQLSGMSEKIEKLAKKWGFYRLDTHKEQLAWKKFVFADEHTINQKKILSEKSYYLKSTENETTAPIFKSEPLSSSLKEQLITTKLWHPDCPVPLERLNLLTISYYDFNGKIRIGNLVAFDGIASYLLDAFKDLYHKKYPLEEVIALDDAKKKEQTMALNCRNIVGGGKSSLHSFGLAIDINVSRNPYIGNFKKLNKDQFTGTLIPFGTNGLSYLNRANQRLGMNEAIIKIMTKHGFIEWGGNWQDPVDYMHFQVPRAIAENLVYLNTESAMKLIKLVIQYPEAAKKMSSDQRWNYLYQLYPDKYIEALKTHFPRLSDEKESTVINEIYLDLQKAPDDSNPQ